MKTLRFFVPVLACLIVAGRAGAASPQQEQAFLDAYKQAFEAKDADGLKALMHTEGADPTGLEFYQMMMTSELGGQISLELRDLTPEDIAKAGEVMPMPTGGNVRLAPAPYKKLVITIKTDTADNKSTSTSEVFVADEGDKILISTPAPAP